MVSPKSTPLLSGSLRTADLLTANVGVAVRRVIVGSSSISPSLSSPSSEVSLVCTPEGLLAVPKALFSTLPLSTACWSIV